MCVCVGTPFGLVHDLKGVHLFSASPKLCSKSELGEGEQRGENTPREGGEAALSSAVSSTQRETFLLTCTGEPALPNCTFSGSWERI